MLQLVTPHVDGWSLKLCQWLLVDLRIKTQTLLSLAYKVFHQ